MLTAPGLAGPGPSLATFAAQAANDVPLQLPRLGDGPLPVAGGQPRRCTGARPNLFSAVGSENTAKAAERVSRCSQKSISAVDRMPAVASGPRSVRAAQPYSCTASSAGPRLGRATREPGGERLPGRPGPIYLFQLCLGASIQQLLQRSVGVGLGDAFLHCLGSAIDHVLGFLQAQTRQLAHGLDD